MPITPRTQAGDMPLSQPVCEMRAVDPANPTDTAWAAQLHRELFAEIGMIAQLGERVLQRFCYGRLIKDGLMRAVLAVVDGRPAGLAAFTVDSQAFFRAIVGSHLSVMLREVAMATILTPKILLGFPSAARLVWERRTERLEKPGAPVAEVLAFGVREEFRGHDFVRATGVRVSEQLLYHSLMTLKSLGVREGRGVVLAHNRPAVAYLSMRASQVRPYHNAAKPSVEVWYDVELALRLMEGTARSVTSDTTSS